MTARIEPSLLGKMTERQVLHVLQVHGPLSRAEVARRTGLSAPAVSRAASSLLRSGLIEEMAESPPTGGRPATRMRLAIEGAQVLGIAVDADCCRIVSAGLDGRLHDVPRTIATPGTYDLLLESLLQQARKLMNRPGVTTLGVGLSLPGLIDYRSQRGVLSPNLPLTDGRTPSLDLARALGVPCLPLQESHALCLAEQHHGQAKGLDHFAMLDIHTGVGLGIVSGGSFLAGHSGLAGELGHITVVPDGRRCGCGNQGCLETVASDTSLVWRVSQRLHRKTDLDEVISLAHSGRVDLSAEIEDVCRYLAVGIAAVINLYNPSRLFVHGRLFEIEDSLFDRVVTLTRARTLRPSFSDCVILRATGQKFQGAVAGIIQHLTSAIAPALETKTLCFPTEASHAIASS